MNAKLNWIRKATVTTRKINHVIRIDSLHFPTNTPPKVIGVL